MELEYINAEVIYQASLGGVPLSQGTTFVDQIIDWIVQKATDVINSVRQFISNAWTGITATVTAWVTWAVGNITGWLTWIKSGITDALSWLQQVYTTVSGFVSRLWVTVSSAVGGAIGAVSTWINTAYSNAVDWFSSAIANVRTWITTAVSGLWTSVSALYNQISGVVRSYLSSIVSDVSRLLGSVGATISGIVTPLVSQLSGYFDYLRTWLTDHVVKPMAAWFDTFVNRVLDFPAWIGKLFDAVEAWLTVDVPGHSPRWTAIFESIGNWFATWFYEFPRWFFKDTPERVAYGLAESFKWVTDGLTPYAESFLENIDSFARQVGRITPETAGSNARSLTAVGLATVTGLFGMTVAGELLHPLKQLGLGNLAAVIYDLTNYKMLTGAFVGVLAATMIQTPLRYYYNSIFRPRLPSEGALLALAGEYMLAPSSAVEDAISGRISFGKLSEYNRAGFKDIMKYHGYADEMIDKMYEQSDRPLSYFALAAVAKLGVFDARIFRDELRNGGYSPAAIELLFDMFTKQATEGAKGVMLGAAMSRFQKGLTDEAQFESELLTLRANPMEIPFYITATKLNYATDYASNLLSAYQTAVRNGNMSLSEFREALLGIPLMPDKVEAYVLMERARMKPTEKLKPTAPPNQLYLNDEGKVIMDTIRRRRLKETISRDEEVAGLLAVGVPVSFAEAIADNDDIRLAEKVELVTTVEPPYYETDAGKVEVDTIRRARRKLTINREQEVQALLGLEVPDWYATAIADNDDVRLAEKGGGE